MEAKLILYAEQYDECWEALSEKYNEDYVIEEVLGLARRSYPEVMREDGNEIGEVEGEVQGENGRYILTWEDGIGECIRIYQKPPYNTKIYYGFNWGDGNIEEFELTPDEYEDMKDDFTIFETMEEAEKFARGE